MPIRDFFCEDCQTKFESITTSLTTKDKCPHCEGENIKLLPGGYMSLYNIKGDIGSCTPSKGRYKKMHD